MMLFGRPSFTLLLFCTPLWCSVSFVPASSRRRRCSSPSTSTLAGRTTATTRLLLPLRPTHVICRANNEDHDDDKDEQLLSSSLGWLFTLVLPLLLVYVSNQWARSSIYYLVDFSSSDDAFKAMNVDIGFNEAQYGVLASVAFTSLFAIASLGAGIAADRANRKTLTVLSALSWSIATLGTAFADSYEAVIACRVAMGLACAFSTPTAYTLIQNNVPKTKVATASSLYGTGVALGSGLASLTLLLDNNIGWRQALYVIAATGFASAAISSLTLPNDDKKEKNTTNDSNSSSEDIQGFESILTDVRTAFSTDRAQWIYLASFLRFCSGLCIGVWSAPYFRMVFDGRTDDYSIAQAAISAVGASVSGLLGGTIADMLSSGGNDKDMVGRRLWVPVVGSLLAAPTWYLAVHSPESFEISMAWLAAEYFVAECWFGPTISTLQSTVGPKIGGTAQGLFTLTGAVANFAPSILGFIYGQAVGGDSGGNESSAELSNLLSAAVCFGYLSSAFCFGMAARSAPPSQSVSDRTLKKA